MYIKLWYMKEVLCVVRGLILFVFVQYLAQYLYLCSISYSIVEEKAKKNMHALKPFWAAKRSEIA